MTLDLRHVWCHGLILLARQTGRMADITVVAVNANVLDISLELSYSKSSLMSKSSLRPGIEFKG